MKIFAGGIATETNTFSPLPTSCEDFLVQRGKDVLEGRIERTRVSSVGTWFDLRDLLGLLRVRA